MSHKKINKKFCSTPFNPCLSCAYLYAEDVKEGLHKPTGYNCHCAKCNGISKYINAHWQAQAFSRYQQIHGKTKKVKDSAMTLCEFIEECNGIRNKHNYGKRKDKRYPCSNLSQRGLRWRKGKI